MLGQFLPRQNHKKAIYHSALSQRITSKIIDSIKVEAYCKDVGTRDDLSQSFGHGHQIHGRVTVNGYSNAVFDMVFQIGQNAETL